jgi:hypothetical protein
MAGSRIPAQLREPKGADTSQYARDRVDAHYGSEQTAALHRSLTN